MDPSPPTFAQLHVPTRVLFGPGAAGQTGEALRSLGATRAMVVSDPGVAAAGHAGAVASSIERAGLIAGLFSGAHENPTTRDAQACRDAAADFNPDVFVAVGGGSAIDTARAGNMLLTNGGRMEDYWGVGKVPGPMLPFVAVPTTTGTGSEMQSFALIMNDEGRKMACGDKKAASAVAILDPVLATTQPAGVRACTALDCIAHALESAVCTRATPFSRVFSLEAWSIAAAGFGPAIARPRDLTAQGDMLRAAAMAGLAIEHSMLGAAHALANPLTARHGMTHGQAVGTVLPHVVRFNAAVPEAREIYARLAAAAGLDAHDPADAIARWLTEAIAAAGLPGRLSEGGVGEDDLPALAEGAAQQWTGRFNPRQPGPDDWIGLYRAAL